jgi:hypothetical protein
MPAFSTDTTESRTREIPSVGRAYVPTPRLKPSPATRPEAQLPTTPTRHGDAPPGEGAPDVGPVPRRRLGDLLSGPPPNQLRQETRGGHEQRRCRGLVEALRGVVSRTPPSPRWTAPLGASGRDHRGTMAAPATGSERSVHLPSSSRQVKRYAGALPEARREAAARMDQLLGTDGRAGDRSRNRRQPGAE